MKIDPSKAGPPVAPAAAELFSIVRPAGCSGLASGAVNDGLPPVALPPPECSAVLVQLWLCPVTRKLLLVLLRALSLLAKFFSERYFGLRRRLQFLDGEFQTLAKDRARSRARQKFFQRR